RRKWFSSEEAEAVPAESSHLQLKSTVLAPIQIVRIYMHTLNDEADLNIYTEITSGMFHYPSPTEKHGIAFTRPIEKSCTSNLDTARSVLSKTRLEFYSLFPQ